MKQTQRRAQAARIEKARKAKAARDEQARPMLLRKAAECAIHKAERFDNDTLAAMIGARLAEQGKAK